MCGISGIISLSNKVTQSELKKMTDTLAHRGPDGEGFWINADSKVGLAHRRLSIIDLTEMGCQPMNDSESGVTITFNGEIYNYIELAEELKKKNYSLKSNSDTEVLLKLYHCYGEKCLEHIDGMFAFVIYDEKKNRLFGARDRFGEKPFYYNLQKQVFSFASEMKALWAIGAPRTFRKAAVERYINENSLIAENPELTFYKEINQLAPSEAFTLQLGNDQLELKKWKYWDLSGYALKTSGKLSFDEAMTQLKFHLNNSVKMRLRSDVPIGSSLSGGVDSSIIASLILNQEGTLDPFHTFTACSPGSPKDERALVELFVKSKKNIQSHTVNIDNNEFDTIFQKVCYHQEEPFLSTSILAQWKVMELANQKGITVLLDGQGADELFAGYLPYYRTHLYNLFSQNNKTYASELDHYNKIHPERPIKDFKDLETVRGKIGRLKNKIVKSQGISDTKKALIHDLSSGNLQLLLRFADRNSMAFSREVRLPYLSKALVEFVMSLPDNFLLRDGWTKYILRKTFDDQVLPEILWKTEKIGFEAPGIKHSDFVKSKIAKGRNFLTDNFDLKKESIEDWKLLNIGCFSEGIN